MHHPDSTFRSAYLKAHRAQHHINSIIRMTQPLWPGFFDLEWRPPSKTPVGIIFENPETNSEVRDLTFAPKCRISEQLALAIGDAVHNLRASLDHAATTVVRAADRSSASFVTFPFHEKRENLVASSYGPIEAAFPNANVTEWIRDTIKPYRGGNTDLLSTPVQNWPIRPK